MKKKKPKAKPRRTRTVWLVYADEAQEPFGCGLNLSEAANKIADLARAAGGNAPVVYRLVRSTIQYLETGRTP